VLDKLALLKNGTLEMFGPSAAVMSRLHAGQSNRVVAFPALKHSQKSDESNSGALA
jgi:ABC-type protease/lipase transport system fused ATPase/permease subunit